MGEGTDLDLHLFPFSFLQFLFELSRAQVLLISHL